MASLDQFFSPNTLVACHDAGAAQMILDNTTDAVLKLCTFRLRGPAKNIFSGYDTDAISAPLLPSKTTKVICGTGWQDSLEFEIMKEASRRNIPSLAVVDRATNFYFRFSRDGETVKPTAVVIPQYEIPKLPADFDTRNVLSFFDDGWQRQIDTIKQNNSKQMELDSLFIGQPLVDEEGHADFNIQYQFLRDWLASRTDVSAHGFRPHPSDKTELPGDLRNKVKISDRNLSASEDIARAREIIGIDSFLLEISALAGKKTFRCCRVDEQLVIEKQEP